MSDVRCRMSDIRHLTSDINSIIFHRHYHLERRNINLEHLLAIEVFHLVSAFHHPEGGVNDGLHFLINRDELPLGDVGESEVWLLCPERQSGRFFPGLEFDIYGGATLVGHGFITKVVNKHLAKRGSQAL